MDHPYVGQTVRQGARDDLILICQELGILESIYVDNGVVKVREGDLDPLAVKLSRIAQKDPPWTGGYLYNVIKGYLEPSYKLTEAILQYGRVIDGLPSILAGYEPVTIYALPGSIKPNTVITGKSKECRRPDCVIQFLPKVWNQGYCSWDCNDQDRSRRRKKRGWK